MTSRSNHARRIPVTLVTGFLGSGKTTLINAGLKSPALSKAVVVVNEFGEVGLDHQLYTSSNDAVVVLENGCLCCTVRSELIETMNSLYHDRAKGQLPDFDRVIIETTGLADPGPILQAFLSEPTLDGLYRVTHVVTVVDAVNWPSTAEKHKEALRQVALADDLLISKTDLDLMLHSPSDRERLSGRLAAEIKVTPQTRNLFTISFRDRSPKLAHDVVQTLLTIFIESATGSNRTDMENARRFLERQIQSYEQQLRAAEKRRADFRVRYMELLPNDMNPNIGAFSGLLI